MNTKWVSIVPDWVAWQQAGQDEDSIQRYLLTALERSGLCITVQNDKRDYLYIANLFDCWSIPATGQPDDLSLFGPDIADRLDLLKTDAVRDTGQKQAEIVTDDDRSFDFTVETTPADGDTYYILTRIIDLSEKRTAERVTKALLREVSHRSKNLLAIIQSLASQTARNSSTIAGFSEKFRGRLHALSQAQDLITDSEWRGAMLQDLLRDQASRFMPDHERQIRYDGPNIRLQPNVSLHLGLALHELIMKAIQTTPVANGAATVDVRCRPTMLDGQQAVELTWKMPNGLDHATPASEDSGAETNDFSRVLLEKVVPASMSGRADYRHAGDELVYTIVFPISDEDETRSQKARPD